MMQHSNAWTSWDVTGSASAAEGESDVAGANDWGTGGEALLGESPTIGAGEGGHCEVAGWTSNPTLLVSLTPPS